MKKQTVYGVQGHKKSVQYYKTELQTLCFLILGGRLTCHFLKNGEKGRFGIKATFVSNAFNGKIFIA